LGLAQGKRTRPPGYSSDYPRASKLLTEQISDTDNCATGAVSGDALTEDGGINQGLSQSARTADGARFSNDKI